MAETGPSGGTAVGFFLPKENAYIIAADRMVTSETIHKLSEENYEVLIKTETPAQKVYAIDHTLGCAIIGSRSEAVQWITNLSELVNVDDKFNKEKGDDEGKKEATSYAKKTKQFDEVVGHLESYRKAYLKDNKYKVGLLLAGWDDNMQRRFVHMHNTGKMDIVDAWWIGTGRDYAMTSLNSARIKDMNMDEGVDFAYKAVYVASLEDHEHTGDSVDVLIVRPDSVQKLDSVLITTLRSRFGDDPLKLEQKYAAFRTRVPSLHRS